MALKIVKSEMPGDEIFLKRFKREAEIAQRIEHPNVVPVIATGDHDGLPWAAQRFISGGSLEQRLDRWGALDLHQVIGIFKQVAGGLDVLHENGLIHRDLKPGNILLDERGTPFIADFGLAKDHQHEGTVLTRPGQALGSMDYMAPEQIRGEEVERRDRRLRAGLHALRAPDRQAAVRRQGRHADHVGAPAGSAAAPVGPEGHAPAPGRRRAAEGPREGPGRPTAVGDASSCGWSRSQRARRRRRTTTRSSRRRRASG